MIERRENRTDTLRIDNIDIKNVEVEDEIDGKTTV